MPAGAERTVLHVLPHSGGGGETYIDVLGDMPGYRFWRVHLASSSSASPRRVARGVLDVLRRARAFDVLHVHGEVASALCLPLVATRPSVVTLHGLHLVRRTTGARRRAAAAHLRALLRATDCTICVSQSEHRELIRAVGDSAARRAVVIRNGVHLTTPSSAAERRSVRNRLEIAADDPVAIWVGSLDEHKNPLAAIRAAEEAAIKLLVVGDGPLRAEVEKQESKHVRVLGERHDVASLLAASDIFVLTSRREGLAFSLLEAMVRGLAPVVFELPENLEAIGDAGISVAQGDEGALVEALRLVVESQTVRVALGRRARQRIAECFSADEMISRTRAVYDDVLADRQPRTRPLPTAQ